jgi:hypothetical protein
MEKKTLIDLISGLFAKTPVKLAAQKHPIQEWLDTEGLVFQQGSDLVRINADGQTERIDGFFGSLGGFAELELLFPEQLAQLKARMDGARASESFQLAQAQPLDSDVQTDSGQATPIPKADALVAKVAEVSGTATVVRNGTVLQLNFGDAIYIGDIVTTDSNAKIKLTLIDAAQPDRAGNSAQLGDQTRVMVTGQIIAADAGNFFQVNLKVDGGVLSVDKPNDTAIQVQVYTPAGQLPVPQTGLNVVVQANTGQTAVSTLSPPISGTSSAVSANVIGVDGNPSQLQLSTTPVVIGQAPAPQPVIQAIAPVVSANPQTSSSGATLVDNAATTTAATTSTTAPTQRVATTVNAEQADAQPFQTSSSPSALVGFDW